MTNITEQTYVYHNTRTATQMEAVINAAIYQHSLRVRVISHADDPVVAHKAAIPDIPKRGTARVSTPVPETQNTDASTLHSRAESSFTAATAVGSDNGRTQDKKNAEKNERKKNDKNLELVGRLNSLITADLNNINGGKDWLLATVNSVLQVILASWFLYLLLGWSAFVGLATMIGLVPIPAWVSKFMNTSQACLTSHRNDLLLMTTLESEKEDGSYRCQGQVHQGGSQHPSYGQAIWMGIKGKGDYNETTVSMLTRSR
jgi:hypothetical protein